MRKRLLAGLLCVCLLVGLLPATALANGEGTSTSSGRELDISQGSITITNDGYTLGNDTEPIISGTWGEGDHKLTITQRDPDTPVSNYIEVKSGTVEITLKGVNLTNSTRSPFKVSGNGTEATVILADKNNTLLSTTNGYAALEIGQNSTVNIKVPNGWSDEDGKLEATGGNYSAGIGASNDNRSKAGTLKIYSGTIDAKGGTHSPGIGPSRGRDMAAIYICGGHITNRGSCVLGAGTNSKCDTVEIAGGYVNTDGVAGDALTISGGTIVTTQKPALAVTDSLTITGGNIGDSYSGDITGRKQTKLYFYNNDFKPKNSTQVTVIEGSDNTAHIWTAQTDEKGAITTYLADSTKQIMVKVGDDTSAEMPMTISDGRGLVGAQCACDSGTLTMLTKTQNLEVVLKKADLKLSAQWTGCPLPEGFHGDYENVTYKVESVTVGETTITEDLDTYASVSGDTLTVNRMENAPEYTVQVRAVCGPENEPISSDSIEIHVFTYQSVAEDGELDIHEGTITVTARTDENVGKTVYTQNGEETVVEAGTSVTITGKSEAGEDISVATNMIDILGGNPTIVLKDVTITMNSDDSAADLFRPAVVLRENQTATIKLEGVNKLTGGNQAPGVQIDSGATLTIEGDGTLNAATTNHTGGIGSGRSDEYGTPGGGNLIIKDGAINATGHGDSGAIGSSHPSSNAPFGEIAIQGGVITTAGSNNSLKADKVTISGGTLLGLHKPISDTTLNITGGNIGDSYTGEITGQTRTQLFFYDAEQRAPKANAEVTVTENGRTWTAFTDNNGVITTYLDSETSQVTMDGTPVTITEAHKGAVGAFCTCGDHTGAPVITTPTRSLTTINGTAMLELTASYDAGSCVLPDGFHGAYEDISGYKITKVVKNGQFMTIASYAKISGSTLTVYGEINQDPYTVYVQAVSGPEDDKVYGKEIAITVNTYVSEAATGELDITEGSIIITDTGYSQGTLVYSSSTGYSVQNSEGSTATETPWSSSDHALTIIGASTAGTILIMGGNPTITLKDLQINQTENRIPGLVLISGTSEEAQNTATVVLEGTNTLNSKDQVPGVQINKWATLTIKGSGTLNASTTNHTAAIGAARVTSYSLNPKTKLTDGDYRAGGNLIIESGTIVATGARNSGSIGHSYDQSFGSITIRGGVITTFGSNNSLRATDVTISSGTLAGLHNSISATTLNITGGNIGDSHSYSIEGRELTKLYFVEEDGTPKDKMKVTVIEGTERSANTWTAFTDNNGVITTYLASTTKKITVSGESQNNVPVSIPESRQALIGGGCSCSADTVIKDITWETGLPESITLHNLTDEDSRPVTMNYNIPAAQLVIDSPCNMPIHPELPEIEYDLSVVKDDKPVQTTDLDQYAKFSNYQLTLLPGNAPYTVTLTAKAGDKSVSDSITVNKVESTSEISTINLSLGDAEIRYTADGGYTYTQGTTIDAAITGTILITGFAPNGSVTVMGGSPTLIINQNDPGDVWTLYSGENAGQITLQPRSFNNKLRFGTMGSTMPELSYVSAAPKLKLNPDQGDITFNAGGSVTQGKFTITALKDNEEIAIWGADLEEERTVTNSTGKSLDMEINGEDISLEANGTHEIPKAKYTNWFTDAPTTKTYIFDNGDDTYSLVAVGEGDADAPALGTEQTAALGLDVVETQKKITSALLDSDFTGCLVSGMNTFLFEALLEELDTNQCSDIVVYAYTIDHLILGASLTSFTWGDYCKVGKVTIEEGNQSFVKDEAGALYTSDYSTLLLIPTSVTGDYTTHPNCTTVNRSATMLLQLSTITLGKNVTSLDGGNGRYLFFSNRMSAINVEAGNQVFASKDGILYNKEMTRILACPRNVVLEENTLVVPETVTDVNGLIFAYSSIEKLVIPEGANINSGNGFGRMPKLKEIVLLGSYSGSINDNAASSMPYLYKVTVADGFTFSGSTFDRTNMEWIRDAGITVTGGDTPYDGEPHSVTVTAADGLTVEYLQADGTWEGITPLFTEPGSYTVSWRITKPADDSFTSDRELYSSRTFTITELEASADWFTLTAVKPDTPEEGFTPVTLNQPTAAPSLKDGYKVWYSKDSTEEETETVPTAAGSYLVTVEITGKGYKHDTLTLGYYTILSKENASKKVLSFVTNGGDPIQPIIAAKDGSITKPGDPTRDGYEFDGWYEDVTLRTKVEPFPTQMPEGHKTYYAKWIRETYEITYNLDGGTGPGNPTAYNVETNDFTLKAPTKPGYEFTGWTGTGLSEATKEVTIQKGSTEDRSYTANWQIIIYTITYENHVTGERTTYTINDTQSSGIALADPATRDGYTFAGWTMVVDGVSYLLPATGAEIPQGTLGDITLSGIWLAEDQTLTLDANGGQFEDGAMTLTITADYDSELAALAEPTREGYTFAGWYNEPECITAFTPPATMPLTTTIYAKWEPIPAEPSGPSGGGGGGSVSTSYASSVTGADHGDVTVSPRNAAKGTTVTVVVTPDAGYVLKSITVTDKDGKAQTLTDLGGGTFTFVMPASKVTITVEFQEETAGIPETAFSDVPADAWYAEAVQYVYEKGLMQGISETEFAPNVMTSRTMLATILWRLEGEPKVDYAMSFTDVAGSAWYTEAVRWAASKGIIEGYSETLFGSEDNITREQMAVMLWRYLGSPTADSSLSGYPDAGSVSTWAAQAMAWAVETGLITGNGAGQLNPQGTASRAEIATFLMRFVEIYGK